MENIMGRKKQYERPGMPIKHPPIRIIELDEVYKSYTEVANRIDGKKACVYLCLAGMRRHHRGYSFEFVRGMD